MEDCVSKVWKVVKFFQTRDTLDWKPVNSACVIAAVEFGFPVPKPGEALEPRWWTKFRKYLNTAIANKRGHVMDEIRKKMASKCACMSCAKKEDGSFPL